MKNLRSHFWYSKSQRNGILFLVIIIFVSKVLYLWIDFYRSSNTLDDKKVAEIRLELDSLHKIRVENQKQKSYPFNPNYITDFKGYQLGMSIAEIDRLHQFRAQGKFVNSKLEFQKVTKISDSLLNEISQYFKFPDWVRKRKKEGNQKKYYQPIKIEKEQKFSTRDLNAAKAEDFYALEPVNESLANRIVKYRNKLQGFYFEEQLNEVWYIKENQVKEILKVFQIESKPKIQKLNMNTATFKEVLSIPYIDYDLCKKLFAYRDEVAELQSISEIKNVEGFPMDLYSRIVVYLKAE